ncbi:hypothetical protein BGZ52_011863, partial [Haplosporangium bisporale]
TTAVLTSSLQTVRSASECGRHLAQRSRSSLNRFLGAVVEATSGLSGGHSDPNLQELYRDQNSELIVHGESDSYDRRHEVPGCTPSMPTPQTLAISNTPPSPRKRAQPSPISRQLSARAKFFVCEDTDDESDDEFAPQNSAPRQVVPPMPSKSEHQEYADCEASSSDHDEDEAEEGIFEKKSIVPHGALHPSRGDHPDIGRRQSLLSDLFMAEKMRTSQQCTFESTTTVKPRSNEYRLRSASKPLSRCHSTANSDGESSNVAMAPTPELYPSTSPSHPFNQHTPPTTPAYVHRHHNRHFYTHHEEIQGYKDSTDHGLYIHQHPKVPTSGLTRTKKSMFKNLDELAMASTAHPPGSPTACPLLLSEQGRQNLLHLPTQSFHSPPRRYSHVPMSLKL